MMALILTHIPFYKIIVITLLYFSFIDFLLQLMKLII